MKKILDRIQVRSEGQTLNSPGQFFYISNIIRLKWFGKESHEHRWSRGLKDTMGNLLKCDIKHFTTYKVKFLVNLKYEQYKAH